MESKNQVVLGGPPCCYKGVYLEKGHLGLGDDATKSFFETIFERGAQGPEQGGKGAVLGDSEMNFLGIGAPETGLVTMSLRDCFCCQVYGLAV